MMDRPQIGQWTRISQALMEKERHLAQLLVMEARGDVSVAVVQRVRSEVEALRRLADSTFDAEFGSSPG